MGMRTKKYKRITGEIVEIETIKPQDRYIYVHENERIVRYDIDAIGKVFFPCEPLVIPIVKAKVEDKPQVDNQSNRKPVTYIPCRQCGVMMEQDGYCSKCNTGKNVVTTNNKPVTAGKSVPCTEMVIPYREKTVEKKDIVTTPKKGKWCPSCKVKYIDLTQSECELCLQQRKNNEATKEKNNTTKKDGTGDCKSCMMFRNGECLGRSEVCEDFQYTPTYDDDERKNWPMEGDAMRFRRGWRW